MEHSGTNTHVNPTAAREEKRGVHRTRVLKAGSISFNSGYASYHCMIKNMTSDGAMLKLGDTNGLPSEFDFVVKGENKKLRAKLVWRAEQAIGIRLMDQNAAA